jgi:hypothetical protein
MIEHRRDVLHNRYSTRRSRCVDDSRHQEPKPRSTVHLPLDHFQAVDMTLDGTVAPPFCHSRENSRFVSANAFGKSSYFRTGGRFTFHQPVTERPARAFAEHIRELIC